MLANLASNCLKIKLCSTAGSNWIAAPGIAFAVVITAHMLAGISKPLLAKT
jgi:hypothetical protein